jgi:hypothetical protein
LRAIDIRERREEAEKRVRGAIAVSVLSAIGVPLGFLVAFFGINATQVDSSRSIFDIHHYLGVYVAAGVLALIPVLVFAILYSRSWLRTRDEARRSVARMEASRQAQRSLGTDDVLAGGRLIG